MLTRIGTWGTVGVAVVALFLAGCSSSGDGAADGETTGSAATASGSDAGTGGTEPGSSGGGEVADNPDNGVTADVIKIGWMGDATGPTASAQAFNLAGSQAAVAWYNEQGGVLGRDLELVDKDDQFNAETAAVNYSGLVNDDKVLAIVQLGGSHISTALMPNVEADQIPVIGPPQTIDAQLANPYVFNNIAHYGDEADAALAFLGEKVGGIENARVAVLQLELPSGDEWDTYIKLGLEELGGTYVDRILINASSPDYAGSVTQLKQMIANDDVNYIAFHGAPSTGLGIVTEMQTQGVEMPIVGIHGIAGSTIYTEGPEQVAAEAVNGVHSFLAPTSDCEVCGPIREFVAGTEWESQIGELNFGHGWLDIMIAAQAIERAAESGEVSRASLTEALRGEFDTGGLSCPIDWSESNHSPCAAPFEWLPDEDRIEVVDGFESWQETLDGNYGLFDG